MSTTFRIALYGAAAITAFDVLASAASRALKFPYSYATVGSWLIYAIVAFVVGRRAAIPAAIAATMLVGFVEATLGWWLSWLIGPGRGPTGTVTQAQIIAALIFVLGTAALIGAAAGAVGHARPATEARAP